MKDELQKLMNREQAYAYALGYYDGRSKGTENNPYGNDRLRHAYDEGYERGVADYCDLDETDEVMK